MKLKPVDSEMLEAVGFDPKTRTLEVIFNSGERYKYFAVPEDEYERLMNAESIGQYMHRHVIGHYEYERVY